MPSRPWVALVGPEIEENLSLRYLASSLRANGFEPRIFAFNTEIDLVRVRDAILSSETPPLLVGLSLAFQWRASDFLALAMALREGGYDGHITGGGHFATFAAQDLMRDFVELSSICRQESELTICALARALDAAEPLDGIAGLFFRAPSGQIVDTGHPPLPELEGLPWPDRSGEPAEVFGHRIAPLVASRGCYANCTFCCIAAWHEQALPGKRYRLRPVDDVADEMAWLHFERGIEIFVFHDDNFFLPRRDLNLARFTALADALDARGMKRFCTIVKARPTDVKPDVFRVLRERLNCLRVYVGIETDSEQGLVTLGRWAKPRHNHDAIRILREQELFACFNVLIFDPDTTVESLHDNLNFMHDTADFPFNFGRTELYAGTPLLARMQAEQRVVGDYMQWNYAMHDPLVERVFQIASTVFNARNFAAHALNNALMGTRFEVEAARFFHPDRYDADWLAWGKDLSTRLGRDSVRHMREIIAHVQAQPKSADAAFTRVHVEEVAAFGDGLKKEARALARTVHSAIGQGSSLTDLSDDVTATPLQKGVLEMG